MPAAPGPVVNDDSGAVSSSSVGTGQVIPTTAARRMYSPTAVRPIPTDRAITRSLALHAYFRRRTSRTFRIGNLSAGIVASPSAGIAKGRPCLAQTADNGPQITLSTGWPPSIGIGGRFPSESLAALPRIPHRPRRGDLP
jgi:hypothetical protein